MAEVLIVEDDEQVRVMAESVLQEAGHTVVAATGVDGARALLNTDRHFDVLFIDLNLGHDLEAGLRVAKDAHVTSCASRCLRTFWPIGPRAVRLQSG
jgi:DNA-binding NtrC family response regulator